jgi:beta-lactamase regulating signal transducer with metallopeptidase domain
MAWLLTWLVHGLAIAMVTRFALRALPGLSAATRYAMWWAALVLVLMLPLVRGLTIGAGAAARESAGATSSPLSPASPSSSTPSSFSEGDRASADTATLAPAGASAVGASAVGASAVGASGVGASAVGASAHNAPDLNAALLQSLMPLLRSVALPPISLPRVPDWFVSIVIGLWLGAAMIGLAQIAYSVQAVRRLKSSCRRMVVPREADLPMWSAVRDRGRAVRVRASDCVRTAAVLGLTRPVIAMPRDAAAALTPHEIDQVVLHEYAHVQRYDDWTKLLQVLIGAFAGWHPAVRLMMREIDFEREAACDDYVVDVTGAPRAYARCLTKVIEMMPSSGLDLAAVPHAHSSGSHAATRIERLLDRKRPAGRLAVMPAMAGSATLAVLAFCTVHALPIATDLPHASEVLGAGGAGASVASADLANEARDARAAAEADATRDANVVVVEDARLPSPPAARSPRRSELRIAAASALPIELPFSRFSPLSRLMATQPAASPTTPHAAAASTSLRVPAPDRMATSPATSTPGHASAITAPSAGPAGGHTLEPNAPQAPAAPVPPAAHKPARDNRPGTRRPASTSDTHDMRDTRDTRAAVPPHAETTFALGPVVAAGDSDAMPEASESGHIGRAWENTREATSKAMGLSARAVGTATKAAVGTATKTAGGATRTATNVAAAGMKAGGTQTARALGRVKRTLASVF